MNLYHMNLDRLTYHDVEAFCLQGLPENVILDYKRDLSNRSPEKQVVKGVSSFANTQGGILLYGVGTRGNTKYPDWPSEGMAATPDFEKRVTRWCIEHIDPPVVPMVGYAQNPQDSTKAFGVIRVALSKFTPHVLEGGTKIYVRRADNSDPVNATFQEIELLRNQRERALVLEREHIADLRRRLGPSRTRSIFLVVTPQFSTDDAISLTRLPHVAEKLKRVGFQIGTMRSYSHGIISADVPGWQFALTGRGGLGVGFNRASANEEPNAPITLDSLLGWALLAGKGAKTLSEEAGYWGNYEISYEAHQWAGLEVFDPANDERYEQCADPEISIQLEWPAVALRENLLERATELFWQMMWAYGQNTRMWSEEIIVGRLRQITRDRGF